MSDNPVEAEEVPTRYCATKLKAAFAALYGPQDLAVLTPIQQRCLAAQLYAACSAELLRLYDTTRGRETMFASDEHRLHAAVVNVAERFRRESCDGVLPHIHARRMLQKTLAKWKSSY